MLISLTEEELSLLCSSVTIADASMLKHSANGPPSEERDDQRKKLGELGRKLRRFYSPITGTQRLIIKETQELGQFLCDKNSAYGDSALNPQPIFARSVFAGQPKCDTVESRAEVGLRFKIDDKLSRLSHGHEYPGDSDDVKDLIGYLILLRIAQTKGKGNDQQ